MFDRENIQDDYLRLREKNGDYVRLPKAIAESLGVKDAADDSFGSTSRYSAVKEFLQNQKCRNVIDLGGHCGYFVLSLLSDGLIERATVYDHDMEVLEFGKRLSHVMKPPPECLFLKEEICFDWLSSCPTADLIICQNLLHHAGRLFDVSMVRECGWEKYASEFLKVLRSKAPLGVFCISFEEGKPVDWLKTANEKDQQFRQLLLKAGWKPTKATNVYELVKANQRENKGSICAAVNPTARNAISKVSITTGRLARGRIGARLRASRLAGFVKRLLHDTRSCRSSGYYLYLVE